MPKTQTSAIELKNAQFLCALGGIGREGRIVCVCWHDRDLKKTYHGGYCSQTSVPKFGIH